jgi:subfamily B ATP-binding cassette protein MsbA
MSISGSAPSLDVPERSDTKSPLGLTVVDGQDRALGLRREIADKLAIDPHWTTMRAALRIFNDYVRPHLGRVIITSLAMAVVASATAAIPFMLKTAADEIFKNKNELVLYVLPPTIVFVMALRATADFFGRSSQGYLSTRIVADLRRSLFRKLTHTDIGWLQSAHSGKLVSVVIGDVEVVNQAAAQTLQGLAQNSLQVIGLAASMIYMDWQLAVLVLGVLPLGAWLMRLQRNRTHRSVSSTLNEVGHLGAVVAETLRSMRVVKAYNREAEETERAERVIERTRDHQMETIRTRAASGPAAEALGSVAISAAIFWGGWQGIHGSLTFGDFMGFMTAALLIYQPVKALAALNNSLLEGTVAAGRVFSILDRADAVAEAPAAKPIENHGGSVRFENVSFSYGPDAQVVKHFTLDIPAGKRIALVGPSGGGKSTVLNLLLRLFDPDEGRILIDGQDIRKATISSVRLSSALLTQEPVLFDDTILTNIRFGSENASEEDIIRASKAAAAHDFIMDLPQGYLTRVGEAGNTLSGGQKQRIAFARAMLSKAPILLLDEPTSALDADAEAKVQAALDTLLEGRTVIMVAHRLSTVKRADLICVLDQGELAEMGTQEELLAKGGIFARLHETQFAAAMSGLGGRVDEPESAV